MKEFLKKHPSLKKCIEEQVIQKQYGKDWKIKEDYLMHITLKHLDETQLDKEKAREVIKNYECPHTDETYPCNCCDGVAEIKKGLGLEDEPLQNTKAK